MIAVQGNQLIKKLGRRCPESPWRSALLTRLHEQFGISESPAVAAQLQRQLPASEAAVLPAHHVVHGGSGK
jgi:hypothetical protein